MTSLRDMVVYLFTSFHLGTGVTGQNHRLLNEQKSEMKKQKEKEKWRAKCNYVPPSIEVYNAAPGRLLGTSFYGTHQPAEDSGESDHERAGDGGEIVGAKVNILGTEFSFSDLWDE